MAIIKTLQKKFEESHGGTKRAELSKAQQKKIIKARLKTIKQQKAQLSKTRRLILNALKGSQVQPKPIQRQRPSFTPPQQKGFNFADRINQDQEVQRLKKLISRNNEQKLRSSPAYKIALQRERQRLTEELRKQHNLLSVRQEKLGGNLLRTNPEQNILNSPNLFREDKNKNPNILDAQRLKF